VKSIGLDMLMRKILLVTILEMSWGVCFRLAKLKWAKMMSNRRPMIMLC